MNTKEYIPAAEVVHTPESPRSREQIRADIDEKHVIDTSHNEQKTLASGVPVVGPYNAHAPSHTNNGHEDGYKTEKGWMSLTYLENLYNIDYNWHIDNPNQAKDASPAFKEMQNFFKGVKDWPHLSPTSDIKTTKFKKFNAAQDGIVQTPEGEGKPEPAKEEHTEIEPPAEVTMALAVGDALKDVFGEGIEYEKIDTSKIKEDPLSQIELVKDFTNEEERNTTIFFPLLKLFFEEQSLTEEEFSDMLKSPDQVEEIIQSRYTLKNPDGTDKMQLSNAPLSIEMEIQGSALAELNLLDLDTLFSKEQFTTFDKMEMNVALTEAKYFPFNGKPENILKEGNTFVLKYLHHDIELSYENKTLTCNIVEISPKGEEAIPLAPEQRNKRAQHILVQYFDYKDTDGDPIDGQIGNQTKDALKRALEYYASMPSTDADKQQLTAEDFLEKNSGDISQRGIHLLHTISLYKQKDLIIEYREKHIKETKQDTSGTLDLENLEQQKIKEYKTEIEELNRPISDIEKILELSELNIKNIKTQLTQNPNSEELQKIQKNTLQAIDNYKQGLVNLNTSKKSLQESIALLENI